MEPNDLKGLSRGDIIKSAGDSRTFTVIANYGDRVTAVATADVTNPAEWDLVLKAKHVHVRTR